MRVDTDSTFVVQGVCKDCGNGTLNNELNPAFDVYEYLDGEGGMQLTCNRCGSSHVDVLG